MNSAIEQWILVSIYRVMNSVLELQTQVQSIVGVDSGALNSIYRDIVHGWRCSEEVNRKEGVGERK